MHHALQIQEILLNIFQHFGLRSEPSNLAALARTCQTFKEPALDVLWEELDDLSPLARCLPKASRLLIPAKEKQLKCYSFRRSLTQTEWNILRSYTRRIRSITILGVYRLSKRSIRTLSKFSATQQLFPNLRYLHLDYDPVTWLLFLLPHPFLVSLHIVFDNSRSFLTSLHSLANITPDLMDLSVKLCWDDLKYKNTNHNFICQWRNLHKIVCSNIFLDAETIVHLSRMPALMRLSFKLDDAILDQIQPPDSPLIFSKLRQLELNARSLASVSRLFSQIRFLSIMHHQVEIGRCPSRQDLCSFFTSLKTSSSVRTIRGLRLRFRSHRMVDSRITLGFEDLQPCTAFINLRRIKLNINRWKVDLTDHELLTLASSWPRLEQFLINEQWGWKTPGGITPNGLLKLLMTCRSLRRIALAVDTRGIADDFLLQSRTRSRWMLPPYLFIDVLDSPIERVSVPGAAAFFGHIASRSELTLLAWSNKFTTFDIEQRHVYKSRWDAVKERFKGAAVARRS